VQFWPILAQIWLPWQLPQLLENSGSTFEFTKPIKPYWKCEKFLDFLQKKVFCAILAYIFRNLVAMATPLVPLKIDIASLKSRSQKIMRNIPRFLAQNWNQCNFVLFLFKFGCHGNSLGSLKNSDSVLKFTSSEIPTVHAINFSISCRELMSAFFWPKFGCHAWQPQWLPWNFIYHIRIYRPRKPVN